MRCYESSVLSPTAYWFRVHSSCYIGMSWLHNTTSGCCWPELWVKPSPKQSSFLNTLNRLYTLHIMSTLSIRRPVFLRDTIYLSCLQAMHQPCLNSRRFLGRPNYDTVRRKRKSRGFMALHKCQSNGLTLHHLYPGTSSKCQRTRDFMRQWPSWWGPYQSHSSVTEISLDKFSDKE